VTRHREHRAENARVANVSCAKLLIYHPLSLGFSIAWAGRSVRLTGVTRKSSKEKSAEERKVAETGSHRYSCKWIGR